MFDTGSSGEKFIIDLDVQKTTFSYTNEFKKKKRNIPLYKDSHMVTWPTLLLFFQTILNLKKSWFKKKEKEEFVKCMLPSQTIHFEQERICIRHF